MIDELKTLEEKYKKVMLSPAKIESEYFQKVLDGYAYKKISKGPSYNVKPFDFQQDGFKRGRILKSLPKAIKFTHVYYFDSDDKILMIEIYGQAENIINREYFSYRENCVESIYFESGDKRVRNVSRLINKDEHPLYWINYGMYGYAIWKYIYDNDTLVEIAVENKEHDDPEISHYKVDFEYQSGELSKIICRHPNGYEVQRYPCKG